MGLSDGSSFVVVRVDCTMPEFEMGSSMKLSFADKVAEKRKAKEAASAVPVKAKAAVWSIDDDMDDDDVELVDSDQLLGEEDLAKPDPASLRGGEPFLPFFPSGCVIPHVSNHLAPCSKSFKNQNIRSSLMLCGIMISVCGTTGKRKACKDCTCGLAEELNEGKEVTKKDPKSACGSVSSI